MDAATVVERMPIRWALVLAAVLYATGWVLKTFVPRGQGWLSLLAQLDVLFTLLALFVVVVALFSAVRRFADGRLFASTTDPSELRWEQFEGYLAAYFRRRGATVQYRGGASADGGVDLVLEEATGRRIVQAKHWKTRTVGVGPLRALWGVREDEGARGAVFVTSGRYTAEAKAFARGKALELIDGEQLKKLVAEVKGSGAPLVEAPSDGAILGACPQCGQGTLVRRTARRGARAGSEFLGCSRYPSCKYTRDL